MPHSQGYVAVPTEMMSDTQDRRVMGAGTRHSPARFRSVVAPIDLGNISDRVLRRVTRLPLADDARLTLLHAVPGSLSLRDQVVAKHHAHKALTREAMHLSRSLARSIRIEPLVTVGAASREIAARARSLRAELIVMGRGGPRVLRDSFSSSTAERVMRRSQLPVLVVRDAARTAYRRPALAIDLDQDASHILELLLRVVPPPRPRLTLIHTFQSPYRGLIYPTPSADAVPERKRELAPQVARKLTDLLSKALARTRFHPQDAPMWKRRMLRDSSTMIIEKTARKEETDLLVLGAHNYKGLAHLVFGSVTGDVLRHAGCDVLIVPAGGRKP